MTEENVYIHYPNGDTYNGFIKDCKKHGKGILTHSDGIYFEGNFVDDLKEGYGFIRYPNKDYYFQGQWKNNEPYLFGTYIFDNKNEIAGEYKEHITEIDKEQFLINNIGFLHIPKTGGTDLGENIIFFYINTNIKIYFPNNHLKDGLWYLNNNNIKCFTFIREPIERFISGYKFTMKRNDFLINKYDDINLFIQNNKNIIETMIFRPQVTWLNGDANNTFLIQYNKINNYNNLLYFLKNEYKLNIDENMNFDRNEKINVSSSSGLNCILTDESIEILNNMYVDDLIFYNKFIFFNKIYVKLNEIK